MGTAVSPSVNVHGALDGSFYLDLPEVYNDIDPDCENYIVCPFATTLQMGWPTWDGQADAECEANGLTWDCFFAQYAAIYYKYPYIIAEGYYDIANMAQAGFFPLEEGNEYGEWFQEYLIEQLEGAMENVNGDIGAFFGPACDFHGSIVSLTIMTQYFGTEDEPIAMNDVLLEWYSLPAGSKATTYYDSVEDYPFPSINEACPSYVPPEDDTDDSSDDSDSNDDTDDDDDDWDSQWDPWVEEIPLDLYTLQGVENPQGMCNDGSEYKYYYRKGASDSTSWVIWMSSHDVYCYDEQSWLDRMEREWDTVSSTELTDTTTYGTGIASSNPEQNPLCYDCNVLFFHYCTSDVWTGRNSN